MLCAENPQTLKKISKNSLKGKNINHMLELNEHSFIERCEKNVVYLC